MGGRPALFLDRDGVLNVEIHRLHRAEEVSLIPGAAKAVAIVNGWGVPVVVVTNQAGIAHGLYDEQAMWSVHRRLDELLAGEGAHIDGYFHCPHAPEASCSCRKPAPGLLLQAAGELNIDLSRSVLVGDKLSDLQAARSVGCRAFLVRTGYGRSVENELARSAAELPFAACGDDLLALVPELERVLRA